MGPCASQSAQTEWRVAEFVSMARRKVKFRVKARACAPDSSACATLFARKRRGKSDFSKEEKSVRLPPLKSRSHNREFA
jgi:hypothetical protein